MKQLEGRTAIVTGASRGLGVHIARVLARQGVKLALVARSADALEALRDELIKTGAQAMVLACDLSQLDSIAGLVERAAAELGTIDILINNAGIDAIRRYTAESDSDTEMMVRLDLISPMLLTRRCLPAMLAQRRGHIVNVASLAGKGPTPYAVSYSSAKAGLVGFTHSLRAELRGSGVSVSVVCPGFVTGEGMFANRERAYGARVSRVLGTSTPAEVAEGVLAVLRDDRAELAVNPGPMRLFQALSALAPDTMARIQARLAGVDDLMRGLALAQENEAARGEQSGPPAR